MLILLRMLTGIAMGSEWATGTVLLQESWPDRARAKGAGFMQSGFGFGTLLAALIWLFLQGTSPGAWRWMFVIGVNALVHSRESTVAPALAQVDVLNGGRADSRECGEPHSSRSRRPAAVDLFTARSRLCGLLSQAIARHLRPLARDTF